MTGPTGPELVAPVTDWSTWRKCKICGVAAGKPCIARSGRIVLGRPDGTPVELDSPHAGRVRRAG